MQYPIPLQNKKYNIDKQQVILFIHEYFLIVKIPLYERHLTFFNCIRIVSVDSIPKVRFV